MFPPLIQTPYPQQLLFHPPDPPDTGGAPIRGTPQKSYCSVAQEDDSQLQVNRVPQDLQALGLIKVHFVQNDRLFPKISIAPKFAEVLDQSWKQALIVKLLGRNIGFPTLEQKVKALWKCVADFKLMDLGFGFYMVTFDNMNDRERVIYGGPWLIQGHYLTVRTWSPDFMASDATVSSTMVWIRFPSLPVRYYHEDLLMAIGNTMGKAIKVDKNTLEASRGRFARVCVEIDLTSPLVAKFSIDEVPFRIEYEGLHTACTNCGRYGHLRDVCKFPSVFEGNLEAAPIEVNMINKNNVNHSQGPSSEPELNITDNSISAPMLYGSSMMAPRRQYKPRGKQFASIDTSPPKTTSHTKASIINEDAPVFSSTFQGNGGDALFAASIPVETNKNAPSSSRGGFSYVQSRNRGGKTTRGKGKIVGQPLRDITNSNPFGILGRDVPEQFMTSVFVENFDNTSLDPGEKKLSRGKRSRVGNTGTPQKNPPSSKSGESMVVGIVIDPPLMDSSLDAARASNVSTDVVTMDINAEDTSASEMLNHVS
ncbi:zinc ion binding nucleic acid binding [Euphorbia peplus]|nr:zinc ion binding nucleic acid binding [Euphorbia peplus]